MRLAAWLAVVGVLIGAAPGWPACDPPRCFDVVVPVPRRLHVPDSTVRALLPVGYRKSRARYPVLYLLHGAGDTFATWTNNTDVQEFSAALPLIIVMPDAGRNADAGFYSDWIDGSRQWETFHTRILPHYVERHFRTLGGGRHRAVAGLSMGGFGAMSYAARHRHLFRAAASFSGALDTLWPAPTTPALRALNILALGAWGDPVADANVWHAHNPTDHAADLRDVALFVASGDGTMGGPAGDIDAPAAYVLEAAVAAMSHDFTRALAAASVPHTDDFYAGGYHGWPYWQRELHWVLPQIMAIIAPGRGR